MQRFRKSFFDALIAQGFHPLQAGPIARSRAHWRLMELEAPGADMIKYHRRARDEALRDAARHRKWMQQLLSTPLSSRGNSPPFMPMRCKGGFVRTLQERARYVAIDAHRALMMARFHRDEIAELSAEPSALAKRKPQLA